MSQDLLLMAFAALVLVALLRVWMRRRAAARAAERPAARASTPDQSPAAQQPATWAPPHYDALRYAVAGPSLQVGISIIRARDDALLVSWNAHNVGSLPLAVQWGAPEIVVEANDALQLRYLYDRERPFDAPEMRVYQPGEILSRSAMVLREAVGQDLGGLRVTVAVGYGSADEHEAACADQGSYLDWQRVAVSPPRIVPRE